MGRVRGRQTGVVEGRRPVRNFLTKWISLHHGRADQRIELGLFFSDETHQRMPLCFIRLIRKHLAKALNVETCNDSVQCDSGVRDCASGDHVPTAFPYFFLINHFEAEVAGPSHGGIDALSISISASRIFLIFALGPHKTATNQIKGCIGLPTVWPRPLIPAGMIRGHWRNRICCQFPWRCVSRSNT